MNLFRAKTPPKKPGEQEAMEKPELEATATCSDSPHSSLPMASSQTATFNRGSQPIVNGLKMKDCKISLTRITPNVPGLIVSGQTQSMKQHQPATSNLQSLPCQEIHEAKQTRNTSLQMDGNINEEQNLKVASDDDQYILGPGTRECTFCDIVAKSDAAWEQHLSGLWHKENVQKHLEKASSISGRKSVSSDTSNEKIRNRVKTPILEVKQKSYYCRLCQMNISRIYDYRKHCVGLKHRRALAQARGEVIIPVQKPSQEVKQKSYSCGLCQVNFSEIKEFRRHCVGLKHRHALARGRHKGRTCADIASQEECIKKEISGGVNHLLTNSQPQSEQFHQTGSKSRLSKRQMFDGELAQHTPIVSVASHSMSQNSRANTNGQGRFVKVEAIEDRQSISTSLTSETTPTLQKEGQIQRGMPFQSMSFITLPQHKDDYFSCKLCDVTTRSSYKWNQHVKEVQHRENVQAFFEQQRRNTLAKATVNRLSMEYDKSTEVGAQTSKQAARNFSQHANVMDTSSSLSDIGNHLSFGQTKQMKKEVSLWNKSPAGGVIILDEEDIELDVIIKEEEPNGIKEPTAEIKSEKPDQTIKQESHSVHSVSSAEEVFDNMRYDNVIKSENTVNTCSSTPTPMMQTHGPYFSKAIPNLYSDHDQGKRSPCNLMSECDHPKASTINTSDINQHSAAPPNVALENHSQTVSTMQPPPISIMAGSKYINLQSQQPWKVTLQSTINGLKLTPSEEYTCMENVVPFQSNDDQSLLLVGDTSTLKQVKNCSDQDGMYEGLSDLEALRNISPVRNKDEGDDFIDLTLDDG